MVWTAHKPHGVDTVNAETGTTVIKPTRKTWFGYWKDDGYIKTKHKGRIDASGTWPEIRNRWIEMYRNREVHAGESVMQYVSDTDEWCAEAYIETDYSTLTQEDFERVVQNYAIFKLSNLQREEGDTDDQGS